MCRTVVPSSCIYVSICIVNSGLSATSILLRFTEPLTFSNTSNTEQDFYLRIVIGHDGHFAGTLFKCSYPGICRPFYIFSDLDVDRTIFSLI